MFIKVSCNRCCALLLTWSSWSAFIVHLKTNFHQAYFLCVMMLH
jgi:hypothetical protein